MTMLPKPDVARAWLEEQLAQLGALRNANTRDNQFKQWRQSTLTVIQRIWPGSSVRARRFRRVPFSTPSTLADPRQIREAFEKGCAEAGYLLKTWIDEIGSIGIVVDGTQSTAHKASADDPTIGPPGLTLGESTPERDATASLEAGDDAAVEAETTRFEMPAEKPVMNTPQRTPKRGSRATARPAQAPVGRMIELPELDEPESAAPQERIAMPALLEELANTAAAAAASESVVPAAMVAPVAPVASAPPVGTPVVLKPVAFDRGAPASPATASDPPQMTSPALSESEAPEPPTLIDPRAVEPEPPALIDPRAVEPVTPVAPAPTPQILEPTPPALLEPTAVESAPTAPVAPRDLEPAPPASVTSLRTEVPREKRRPVKRASRGRLKDMLGLGHLAESDTESAEPAPTTPATPVLDDVEAHPSARPARPATRPAPHLSLVPPIGSGKTQAQPAKPAPRATTTNYTRPRITGGPDGPLTARVLSESNGSWEAAGLASAAAELPALGVPASRCDAVERTLLNVAKALDAGSLSWDDVRAAIDHVMEYPELGRRVMPLLAASLHRAA